MSASVCPGTGRKIMPICSRDCARPGGRPDASRHHGQRRRQLDRLESDEGPNVSKAALMLNHDWPEALKCKLRSAEPIPPAHAAVALQSRKTSVSSRNSKPTMSAANIITVLSRSELRSVSVL